MRQINHSLAILTFLLLLSSCTSTANNPANKKVKSKATLNESCNFLPETTMPEWVSSPLPSDEKYMYGYGVATGPSDNLVVLRNNSKNAARRDLSESMQVRIKSEVNKSTLIRSNGKLQKLTDKVNIDIETQSDALLIASEVVEIWLQPNSCNLWAKVRINKNAAKKSEKLITNSVLQSIEQGLPGRDRAF